MLEDAHLIQAKSLLLTHQFWIISLRIYIALRLQKYMLYILKLMEFSVCIAIHVQKYLYEKAVFYLVHQDLSCRSSYILIIDNCISRTVSCLTGGLEQLLIVV